MMKEGEPLWLLDERKSVSVIMLINENVITQELLEKALPIAKEKHKKIGETLIELGFTNELEIAKALSQQLGLELVNVSAINIPEEVQNLVSETVLRKHVMIPYAFDKNNANVCMCTS